MKIAIAGYAIEGKENYLYWRERGDIVIADERETIDDLPDGVEVILGPGAFGKLQDVDLVVRTAGLAPHKIVTGGKIWSATNEFFAVCSAPIIGVTGTKGKGTTSSFIASILRAAGKTVHLVGNIGTSALAALPSITPDDIVVYELSSFQLWDLDRSPHVAVVLGIEPDHLDVHRDFDDYVAAKANIAAHQSEADAIIYHRDNTWSRQIAERSPAGTRIEFPYDLGELAEHVRLPGAHNLVNAAAAVVAARQFIDDDNAIRRGLKAFEGLPHRLKLVAEHAGVKFYDDSIGTTVGSAVAALRSFSEPKIIILGGSSKGTSYEEIVDECLATRARVVAIGETGREITELCQSRGVDVRYVDGLMREVVAEAVRIANPGDVVILSPASASFDQYRNYAHRGDEFIAAVNQLAG